MRMHQYTHTHTHTHRLIDSIVCIIILSPPLPPVVPSERPIHYHTYAPLGDALPLPDAVTELREDARSPASF
jgi:hypothetical protein